MIKTDMLAWKASAGLGWRGSAAEQDDLSTSCAVSAEQNGFSSRSLQGFLRIVGKQLDGQAANV